MTFLNEFKSYRRLRKGIWYQNLYIINTFSYVLLWERVCINPRKTEKY